MIRLELEHQAILRGRTVRLTRVPEGFAVVELRVGVGAIRLCVHLEVHI